MQIYNLLKYAVSINASDIHITVNSPIIARVYGKFVDINKTAQKQSDIKEIINEITNFSHKEELNKNGECEFALELESMERFRVNIYSQKGKYALAIRVINSNILSIRELNLPSSLESFSQIEKGLVLITGSTGSGKSTTLASIIDLINSEKQKHIITLEDPIEHIHNHKKSLIHQREIGIDTSDFNSAFKSLLRQDPDIILIGEIRDKETLSIALRAAETGHLVLSTLHTTGAAKTIDRIVDMFPQDNQGQIRSQLSTVCKGIVSLKLVSTVEGKITPATEVMIMNTAIKNLIRENKIYQIQNIIQTSSKDGMISMDQSLINLYTSGIISKEELKLKSFDYDYICRIVKNN